MLTTNERRTIGQAESIAILVRPVGGTLPHDGVMIHEVPEYQNLYEKRSPSEIGPRSRWKNFEHYSAKSEFPRVSNKMTHTFLAAINGGVQYSDYIAKQGIVDHPYWCYDANWFGSAGKPFNYLPAFYNTDPSLETGFVPDPPGLEEWKVRSLRAMIPTVRHSLSLLNSIYELKDFKRFPALLKDVGSVINGDLLKEFVRLNKMKLDDLNLMPIGKLIRIGAGVFLNQEFNLNPLVSDLVALKDALVSSTKRINALAEEADRKRTFYYTKVISDPTTVKDEQLRYYNQLSYPSWGSGENQATWGAFCGSMVTAHTQTRTVDTEATVFNAQLQCTYLYTEFQASHAKLLALLDRLGINLDPSIIWNAIPWSFLVDWVADVGQWLRDMRVGLMDPTINIHQYSWSVKRVRRIRMESVLRTSPVFEQDNLNMYYTILRRPTIVETSYKRCVGNPPASLLLTSGLTPKEFSLGAALLITRAKRRRRPPSWVRRIRKVKK